MIRGCFSHNAISAGLFITIIGATFVGDYSINNFPPFFLFLPALFALRWMAGISITIHEMAASYFLALWCSVLALVSSSEVNFDYYAFAFAFLFVFFIEPLRRLLNLRITMQMTGIFILALGILGAYQLISGVPRGGVVFGPNVYYRVVGFFFIIFLISSFKLRSFGLYQATVFISSVVALASTGSRGAFVTILLLTFVTLSVIPKSNVKTTVKLSMSAVFVLFGIFLYQYWSHIYNLVWRIFYFSLESGSSLTRLKYVDIFWSYISDASVSQLIFGDGVSKRVFDFYPHNIFLEYIVYHGVPFAIPIVIYSLSLVTASIRGKLLSSERGFIMLAFSPILLGAQFSGSMMESYSLMALSCILIFWPRTIEVNR